MSQISSSGILLKNSVEAVITPLKNGIISLTRVYESLIEADVDPVSGQCTNYTPIRDQIVQSHQILESLEQAASAGLKGLDESLEKLTAHHGKLEQEIADTQCNLDRLRTEKMSIEKLLNDSKSTLEQASIHLDSAEETLRNQEKRRHDAEIVTGVGGGLLLIPVFGWIAGTVMLTVGVVQISQASDAIKEAKKEMRNAESEMQKSRTKVFDYQCNISQLEHDLSLNHDKVEHIHKEIQQVKKQREGVGEFQVKVRRAVHLLNDLSGKTSLAECQTHRFILQEPVMKVMEEVMNAAEKITGNELLCTENMRQLLNTMKENHGRLAAICTLHNSIKKSKWCCHCCSC